MLALMLALAVTPAAHAPSRWAPGASLVRLRTEELARVCAASTAPLAEDFCTGVVIGVNDTLALTGRTCKPDGVSTTQLMAMARRRLADHPEDAARQPVPLLADMLVEAFPCPPPPPKP